MRNIDLRNLDGQKPIKALNQFEEAQYPKDVVNVIKNLKNNLVDTNAKSTLFILKDYEEKIMKEIQKIRNELKFIKNLVDRSIPENKILSACDDPIFRYGDMFKNALKKYNVSMSQFLENFDPMYTVITSDWSEVLAFLQFDILPIVEKITNATAPTTQNPNQTNVRGNILNTQPPQYLIDLANKGLLNIPTMQILGCSISDFAIKLEQELKRPITKSDLNVFRKSNGKEFSDSAISKAVEMANS